MPKRSRNPDANEIAFRVVQESTRDHNEPPPAPRKKAKRKNPAAVALGRKGGLKGGKARAAKLTKEQRAESARKAAAARWANRPNVIRVGQHRGVRYRLTNPGLSRARELARELLEKVG